MVQPILDDQYTAARAYFASVIGLLVFESLTRLPAFISFRFFRRTAQNASHWRPTVWLHQLLSLPLPVPVPFLNDYHVADLVRFTVFAILNIIFALNHNDYTTDFKLYGWLTIANGGLALLLTPRNNLFAILWRIPSPVLLQYHRWMGLATIAQATVHISYNIQHYIKTDQVKTSFQAARIRVGLMAWISLIIILFTAFPLVRRRAFEVFYYAHFIFIIFVAGALYHTTNGPEFLLPGLGLWAVDRAVRFAHNFRKVEVVEVKFYEGSLTKIKTKGLKTTSPGQIAFVQVPGVSLLNWHPFTLASQPYDPQGHATIAIRGLGGYTRRIQQLAARPKTSQDAEQQHPRIRLDGPYGVGRILWGQHPVSVLVAGGIGITPAMSIVSYLIHCRNKTVMNLHSHIYLLWIVKETAHLSWWQAELADLAQQASQQGEQLTLDITVHVTQGGSVDAERTLGGAKSESKPAEQPWELRRGRPDIQAWCQAVSVERPDMDAAVNVCGPRSLIGQVRRAAVKTSSPSGIWHVEEEVFEF